MNKIIILCLLFLISIKTFAYEKDGIYYDLNNYSKEATVTYKTRITSGNKITYKSDYSGSVMIPDSILVDGEIYIVANIGDYAFIDCNDLISIVIPRSIKRISSLAFSGCQNLNNVKIIVSDIASWCKLNDNNPLFKSTEYLYIDENTEITNLVIPEGVTSIAQYCFYNCKNIISVTIPSTVTTIGNNAFYGTNLQSLTINSSELLSLNRGRGRKDPVELTNEIAFFGSALKSITIGEGIESLGTYAFWGCKSLKQLSLPSTLKSIGAYSFYSCDSLETLTIPNGVTTIGNYAFYNNQMSSIEIPVSVTSIGQYAFYRHFENGEMINSVFLPDNVLTIGASAFAYYRGSGYWSSGGERTIYTQKGTKTLLALWNSDYTPKEKGTNNSLPKPYLTIESKQTSMLIKPSNLLSEYHNVCSYVIPKGLDRWSSRVTESRNDTITGDELLIDGLYPDYNPQIKLSITLDNISYIKTYSQKTSSLNLSVKDSVTSSSMYLLGTYSKEDVVVDSTWFERNGKIIASGTKYTAKGLMPNSTDNVQFLASINYGKELQYQEKFSVYCNVKTNYLILKTMHPKVVSAGNVIVAAESNLDDEETNVGFEWRRTDWTDDFSSNTGGAYLFEGTMEGYIRNLYTEKLWKYRPYYTSNSGQTYYGDWVGIDPTNTSYFEPTVHTYAKVDIDEGKATLNGYVMTGTDAITEQGFEYWETDGGSQAKQRAPQNVKTITATGQRMSATLTGLKDATTYGYRAYVKTAGGTTYGEERSFTMPVSTGIAIISKDAPSSVQSRYFNVYTLSGVLVRQHATSLNGLPKGIYIVKGRKFSVK